MDESGGFAVPTLPPPASAPAPPLPLTSPTVEGPASIHQTPTERPLPARSAARRLPVGKLLLALLVGGVAAAGYFGFTALSDDSSDDLEDRPPVTFSPTATSPLVAPINDAKAVVEQINDNGTEERVLAELGLGPLGEERPSEGP